jgi:hypothetical protein
MGIEEEQREQAEEYRDQQQAQAIAITEQELNSEDARLKAMMFTSTPRGHAHDAFRDKLIRLSNFDPAANRRLRFFFVVLLKTSDYGKRAEKFTNFFWDLILSESDIYAATGEGRERVMQNTMRSVLERKTPNDAPRGGLGSLLDISRFRR